MESVKTLVLACKIASVRRSSEASCTCKRHILIQDDCKASGSSCAVPVPVPPQMLINSGILCRSRSSSLACAGSNSILSSFLLTALVIPDVTSFDRRDNSYRMAGSNSTIIGQFGDCPNVSRRRPMENHHTLPELIRSFTNKLFVAFESYSYRTGF